MLLVFGGMYFLLIRLLLTRGYKIILKPKLTRKEYDIFLEQRLDLVFGGINKRSLGRFWRWLLCKCYPKKLQGRCYKLFVIYNYIYILSTFCCIVLWIVALPITMLRWWSSCFLALKTVLLDVPVLILLAWPPFVVRMCNPEFSANKARKVGLAYFVVLWLLLCVAVYVKTH